MRRWGLALVALGWLSATALALPRELVKNRCVNDPKHFSAKQREVLLQAYEYGAPYDLGYTLAAIAWKESCAGEYRMNFQDPSAGIYHAYIPGLIKKYPSLKQNGFTQNMLGALLVKDDAFASREAVNELKYWDKVHQGNWERMIKSYNKGFSWQKEKEANRLAQEYYKDIKGRVQKLRAYLPQVKLEHYNANPKVKLPIYETRPPLPMDTPKEWLEAPYGVKKVIVESQGRAGEFDLLPDQ